jgi:hypothetical protein
MTRTFKICGLAAAVSLGATAALGGPAQAGGGLVHWSAASDTAASITGDIEVGPDRIVIGRSQRAYRLSVLRDLNRREMEAAASVLGAARLARTRLYAVDIPASAKFKSGASLCGGDVTRVVIAEEAGDDAGALGLILFEGSKEPFFEGWRNATGGLCATYSYERG